MPPIVVSLAPVFLIIVLGAILHWRGLMAEAGWVGLERATYYIFFPAMIIMTLAKADLRTVPVLAVAVSLIGAILIMTVLLLALRPVLARWTGMDGPAFTSVFQGATRWNSFVAIATAGALYSQLGLTLTAIAVAAMIPLLNILAVVMLQHFAQSRTVVLGPTLKAIVTNPFIWSSFIGIVINASGLPVPMIAMRFGDILGAAALGAGLLLVGAGLDVKAALKPRMLTWITTVLKLALMPAMAGSIAYALGVTGAPMQVVLLSAGMPTASGSYILARQMGGDAPLMAEILTVQTLVAVLTVPLVLAFGG
ncbi:AEC family transporter [Phreatobacter aquaticus]|uniref:AEC family transporter n=1 Tax=Phreatobacter aquaticus TaxID=2570229 RepID=A0A4D7QGS2_9HYPH|nr:AEC family transporter [Phreatobacter aquaticus]QCK87050.1 AEC family transporter [Phreatobacter aquaticus]